MDDNLLMIIISMGAFFFTLLGTVLVLFLWNRSESRSDMRRVMDLITAIEKEMKDFHGRLCSLEGRWHEKTIEKEK